MLHPMVWQNFRAEFVTPSRKLTHWLTHRVFYVRETCLFWAQIRRTETQHLSDGYNLGWRWFGGARSAILPTSKMYPYGIMGNLGVYITGPWVCSAPQLRSFPSSYPSSYPSFDRWLCDWVAQRKRKQFLFSESKDELFTRSNCLDIWNIVFKLLAPLTIWHDISCTYRILSRHDSSRPDLNEGRDTRDLRAQDFLVRTWLKCHRATILSAVDHPIRWNYF